MNDTNSLAHTNTQCYNKQERQVRKNPHLSFLILGKKE